MVGEEKKKQLISNYKEVFPLEGRTILPSKGKVLWDALDMNNFYFLFLLFSDFIGILFSFSFSFLLDDEEAYDTAVTWHVTWGDVIGLEGGGRI